MPPFFFISFVWYAYFLTSPYVSCKMKTEVKIMKYGFNNTTTNTTQNCAKGAVEQNEGAASKELRELGNVNRESARRKIFSDMIDSERDLVIRNFNEEIIANAMCALFTDEELAKMHTDKKALKESEEIHSGYKEYHSARLSMLRIMRDCGSSIDADFFLKQIEGSKEQIYVNLGKESE